LEPRLLALWRSTGITFSQRRVLRRLRDRPQSAGDVAASLGISAPTLTRHLSRLEQAGLITRTVDLGDRRKVLVELTSGGRRVLAGHRVFAGSPLLRAAGELSASERQALVGSLGLLVAHARELGPDADE
ncbi:MAG TPA: MarR family transcriptional regulator, partial [Candidatus Sulfotelmatobacter sp.]|nr:MarR family transcriptional regulator [Candidatus Sulfotelmatobacter sp.]